MADRLFLIDGSAFAFRAFFAIRGLSDSKGRPTNAVFGFARVLLKLLREHDPSHIAVVFDASGPTFRDEMYAEYKATRPPTPPDLVAQMPEIDALVEAFNIPVLRVSGVEADDVLGTLARTAEAAGLEAVLVTGDKDALQLVSDKITVFDPGKGDTGVWLGPAEARERFGTDPEHVVDAMALIGDTADNVPGVRGIGEKTAKTLMETYGGLDNLYAHLSELKGKQKERLEQDREQAYFSRELVTIKIDVPLEVTLEDLRRKPIDRARLAEQLLKHEFASLAAEFLPDAETAAQDDAEYRLVLTLADLKKAVEEMRAARTFAVDTETTSTDPMRAQLVGVSLSAEPGIAYYIPIGHTPEAMTPELEGEQAHGPVTLEPEEALRTLKPLLEDPALTKVGHNIKYDLIVLARAGIRLAGIGLDTMVASYLTDPSRMRHNLTDVCLHYLKRNMIPIADLIGKGSKAITFDHVPIARACAYAGEDADIALRLARYFEPVLRERGLEALYGEVEQPLIGVLAEMEQTGIAIDPEVFAKLRVEVEGRAKTLESEIYEAAGGPFQIQSPKQLQEVLFTRLGLKPTRRTKTGFSTDVDVLEELAGRHPLPAKVLEYRTLEKLRGTYIDALPKLVHPDTGRIHTSFNQAVAATGRLSSSDPNLQNIPIRTEIGRKIREGFVPGGPSWKLISADYSQIELRVLAHLSGDDHLAEAFREDFDVHRDTASRVFGVMPELVSPEMRRQAKAVNFGVIYGISPYGLARNLGISTAEAARFIEQYFAQYPGVKRWIEATLEQARKEGCVTTLLNRRRYVADLDARDVNVRRGAERIAVNTPVQGSAADIIKVAMVRLHEALHGTKAKLLLQVHDELVVEAPAEEAEKVAEKLRSVMENAATLSVPLKVDVGMGDHWAAIH